MTGCLSRLRDGKIRVLFKSSPGISYRTVLGHFPGSELMLFLSGRALAYSRSPGIDCQRHEAPDGHDDTDIRMMVVVVVLFDGCSDRLAAWPHHGMLKGKVFNVSKSERTSGAPGRVPSRETRKQTEHSQGCLQEKGE